MKKGNRVFCFTILSYIIISLGGCQSNPVEEVVVGKNEEKLESIIQDTSSSAEIDESQVKSVATVLEHYQDSYSGAENSVQINIDADAILLSEAMPVIRVKPHEITSDELQRWAEVLLEGNTAYEPPTTMTKNELQTEILKIKQLLGDPNTLAEAYTNESDIEYAKAYWEEQLAFYESKYESAPDSYVRTETDWIFHPSTYYDYQAELGDEKDPDIIGLQAVKSIATIDGHQVVLEAYNRNEEDYRIHNLWFYYTDDSIYEKGTMQKSQEEAIAMVKSTLERAGLESWNLTICNQVKNESRSYYDMVSHPVYEGVCVTPLPQLATIDIAESYSALSYYEELRIRVSNGKIVSLEWQAPMEILSVENPEVTLLSFDEIKKGFKNQMQVEYTLYRTSEYDEESTVFSAEINIDEINCALVRIQVPDQSNEFYYVPAWSFYGDTGIDYGNGMQFFKDGEDASYDYIKEPYLTINALDGSIINVSLGY